jgi:ATP-dependent RNA helicase SUPV3L1/SUV3
MRLQVHKYDRLTKLTVENQPLQDGSFENVQPGDAVIAFSRRDLYNIKAEIDARTPYRAAMIYGSLPPLARKAQAALFNDPHSEYQVWCVSKKQEVLQTIAAHASTLSRLKPCVPDKCACKWSC